MHMIFPHPVGWEELADRICNVVDGRHTLLSDIWFVVQPWAAGTGAPAPPEKYDSNRWLASGALIVNCARVATALRRGEPVGNAAQPPIEDFTKLRNELERFIGDVSRWVDDDVRRIVMDAAAETALDATNTKTELPIGT